jgi:hypothetical protein
VVQGGSRSGGAGKLGGLQRRKAAGRTTSRCFREVDHDIVVLAAFQGGWLAAEQAGQWWRGSAQGRERRGRKEMEARVRNCWTNWTVI